MCFARFWGYIEQARLLKKLLAIMLCTLFILSQTVFLDGSIPTASAQGRNRRRVPHSIEYEVATDMRMESRMGKDGISYVLFTAQGNHFTSVPGEPKLPLIRKNLMLPKDATDIRVEILALKEDKEFIGETIYPCPKEVLVVNEQGYEEYVDEFCRNDEAYKYDKTYPFDGALVRIGEEIRMRNVRGVAVEACPVQYNPVKGTVKTYKYFKIRLLYSISSVATHKTRSSIRKSIKEDVFEKVYQNTFDNYQATYTKNQMLIRASGAGDSASNESGGSVSRPGNLIDPNNTADYLIITADPFYNSPSLSEFANHRAARSSLDIAIVKTSDIYSQFPQEPTQNDTSIKALIRAAYDGSWSKSVQYVLLVGDADQGCENEPWYLPAHFRENGSDPDVSDSWYACMNGPDDTYSDIMIGRFAVKAEQELAAMANKTIAFDNDVSDMNGWGSRTYLYCSYPFWKRAADMEAYINTVKEFAADATDKREIDEFYFFEKEHNTAPLPKNAVQSGDYLFMAYRGHSGPHGWLSQDTMRTATNEHKFIVFSLTCSSGMFDNSSCESMGENLLKNPDGGAVAFLGSTRLSGSYDNSMLFVSLFNSIFVNGNYVLGGAIMEGAAGKGVGDRNRRRYALQGDPALDFSHIISYSNKPEPKILDVAISPFNENLVAAPVEKLDISITVQNTGASDISDLTIGLYYKDDVNGESAHVADINAGDFEAGVVPRTVTYTWNDPPTGCYWVAIIADPNNEIDEIIDYNPVEKRIQNIPYIITVEKILTGGNKYSPKIHGENIVFDVENNREWHVAYYDLSDNSLHDLPERRWDPWYPVIHGNRIVTECIYARKVSVFNIDTGEINQFTPPWEIWPRGRCSFYGDRLVFMDSGMGSLNDMTICNISDGSFQKLPSTSSPHRAHPHIWQDKIVWNELADLYLYSLSDNIIRKLETAGDSWHSFYDNKAVKAYGGYLPHNGSYKCHFYIYNLSTDTTTPVAFKRSHYPRDFGIYGNRIAYRDLTHRKNPDSIAKMNIALYISDEVSPENGYRIFLTDTPTISEKEPSIYGDRIVWEADGDIYLAEIRDPAGNSPPLLNPIGDKTVEAEQTLVITLNASDPDGDTLTYSAAGLPEGASFDAPTRTFTWTPARDQEGTHTGIHFEVSDGGLIDSEDIDIEVTAINRPPLLDPIGDKTVEAEQTLVITLNASDPDGDTLTYSAAGLPDDALFEDRTFTWTPFLTTAFSNQEDLSEEGALLSSSDDNDLEFVKGEFIIKFKQESYIADGVSLLSSIDKLNARFSVISEERIFKQTGQPAATDAARVSRLSLDTVYLLTVDENSDIEAICAEYENLTDVEYAEPNYYCQLLQTGSPLTQDTEYVVYFEVTDGEFTDTEDITITINQHADYPNDPYYHSSGSWDQSYDDLWGLKPGRLDCIDAWLTSKGEGVVVAVIDTGVDYNHEDIASNIWVNEAESNGTPGVDDDINGYIDDIKGWDFAYNDNNPMDGHGHGSHCAGTIAAVGNNNIGVIGVAPEAKIMAVKGLSDAGAGTTAGLAKCIVYAADNGADILSNSWGSGIPNPVNRTLELAVDHAYSLDCVVVFAAGNGRSDTSRYSPQNYRKTMTVAATNHKDQRAWFSNWGEYVDVAAPGVEILSLRAEDTDMYHPARGYIPGSRFVPALDDNARYYRANGTSMACPHVAGLAALLLADKPNLTNEEVRQIIRISADDIDGLPERDTYGRVNAYEALMVESVCIATITSPEKNKLFPRSSDPIEIYGTAAGEYFESYTLEFATDVNDDWTVFETSTSPVEDGKLGELDPSAFDIAGGKLYLRVRVLDSSGIEFTSRIVGWIMYVIDGCWPQESFYNNPNSVVFADLDLDGENEMIFATTGWFDEGAIVGAYTADGRLIWWYIIENGQFIKAPIAIGDVDGDNYPEIVFGTSGLLSLNQSSLNVLEHNGELKWSHEETLQGFRQPVLADLDEDGILDILINPTHATETSRRLQAYNGDMELLWTRSFPIPDKFDMINYAVGDLENDGAMEIVVNCSYWTSNIMILNSDGSDYGVTITIPDEGRCPSPVLGDVDNDGGLEIVFATTMLHEDRSRVYIYDHDGTIMPNWPKSTGNKRLFDFDGGLALGDIDKDGDLEIFINNEIGKICGWHHTGDNINGWPVTDETAVHWVTPPAIGDIDGDGEPEILINSEYATLNAFNVDGSLVPGYPMDLFGDPEEIKYIYDARVTAISIGNMEHRARIAVGTGSNMLNVNHDKVHLHNTETNYDHSTMEWPMFQHDLRNSGCYAPPASGPPSNHPPVLKPIGNKEIEVGQHLTFTVSATDPDGDEIVFHIDNKPDGAILATNNDNTATFAWTPTDGQQGIHDAITFIASDGEQTDSENINITVKEPPVNHPPVLKPIGNKEIEVGQHLSFDISATDPDGDRLIFTMTNKPDGAILATNNDNTATFAWEPAEGQQGIYGDLVFTTTDGRLTDSEAITITVKKDPHPPQAGTIAPSSGSSHVSEVVLFTTTYTDQDGYEDINRVDLTINDSAAANGAWLVYYPHTNKLYVVEPSGVSYGGYAPGSDYIVASEHCILDYSKTRVSGSGDTLTVTWALAFRRSMIGNKNSYLYAEDNTGLSTGRVQVGTWTITNSATQTE